ncbi:MAG: M15 family metallopeptidase [Rhodothermales bacterium]|nr:M15 family metallopeptidase [Rhodothermales bacterium]
MHRFSALIILYLALLLTGCSAGSPRSQPVQSTTLMSASSDPLVRLSEAVPEVAVDARYFGSDNFIGRPIDGYEADDAMLTGEAAAALQTAARLASESGYGILVYDAYRPQRAVDHFVRWGRNLADTTMKARYYPHVPKAELFDRGYIASRSGHSRGSTIDLTLTRNGSAVDMGTPFDFFDELSHTENPGIPDSAMAHRLDLRDIMSEAGFRNYAREWWHYSLIDEPYPDTYFDIPVR